MLFEGIHSERHLRKMGSLNVLYRVHDRYLDSGYCETSIFCSPVDSCWSRLTAPAAQVQARRGSP
jgi:hypothetical protein